VIGLHHCGDVVRVVELCSIWQGRFSLTMPKIESICGLANFDFIVMLWRDMIQCSEFSPLTDFSLEEWSSEELTKFVQLMIA
jgi:hypothetical protein